MAKKLESKTNKINTQTIIEAINDEITNCYGVSSFVCDSNENNTKGSARKGVSIRKHSDCTYSVDIYVAMAADVKITESLREAQKRIRYTLDRKFPNKFRNVNVFASEVVLN